MTGPEVAVVLGLLAGICVMLCACLSKLGEQQKQLNNVEDGVLELCEHLGLPIEEDDKDDN